MRAVIADSGNVQLRDIDEPAGDGVVLTVAEAGICGSDLHMVQNGMAPVAIGHEFGGWLPDGRLVAVRPTGECGTCDPCSRGFQNACRLSWSTSYGIAVNGGLADRVLVEQSRVFAMSPSRDPSTQHSWSLSRSLFTGCAASCRSGAAAWWSWEPGPSAFWPWPPCARGA